MRLGYFPFFLVYILNNSNPMTPPPAYIKENKCKNLLMKINIINFNTYKIEYDKLINFR